MTLEELDKEISDARQACKQLAVTCSRSVVDRALFGHLLGALERISRVARVSLLKPSRETDSQG